MAHEVVAEVWRGDFLESVHHGTVVATDADGTPTLEIGRPGDVAFPRSSNKPLQALAMLRSGLDLDGELLALACASHSGEDFHVSGALRILASAGLDEDALQCTPDLPLGDDARAQHLARGLTAAPKYMNCSGKHAAMLVTCAVNGWDTATYRSPDHPLQTATRETFAELIGEPVDTVAVDGCGAPLFPASLVGLARAFRRLALGLDGADRPDPHAVEVSEAIRAHPEYVSGTRRDERALLDAIPGSIGKAGAESCYALALSDGRAIALKTDDGAPRVRPVLMAEALRRSGIDTEPGVDTEAVRRTGQVPLLGGGEPVGEIRACF